jgi:hypothetical protein
MRGSNFPLFYQLLIGVNMKYQLTFWSAEWCWLILCDGVIVDKFKAKNLSTAKARFNKLQTKAKP